MNKFKSNAFPPDPTWRETLVAPITLILHLGLGRPECLTSQPKTNCEDFPALEVLTTCLSSKWSLNQDNPYGVFSRCVSSQNFSLEECFLRDPGGTAATPGPPHDTGVVLLSQATAVSRYEAGLRTTLLQLAWPRRKVVAAAYKDPWAGRGP